LHIQAGIPDFIQKERPSVGSPSVGNLKKTGSGSVRSGEGPFDVSEKFTFKKGIGYCCTADFDKGR